MLVEISYISLQLSQLHKGDMVASKKIVKKIKNILQKVLQIGYKTVTIALAMVKYTKIRKIKARRI